MKDKKNLKKIYDVWKFSLLRFKNNSYGRDEKINTVSKFSTKFSFLNPI